MKLGALGDVLRTTFIARGLKEKYKDCTITWLTKKNAESILLNNPFIDKIVAWDDRKQLLVKKWDWIIQLDDEKDVCTFATALQTKRFQGAYINDDGQQCYTDDVSPWFGMGLLRPEEKGGKTEADRIKALNRRTFQDIYAGMFNIENCSNKKPILNLTGEEKQKTIVFKKQNNIPESNIIIGINSGAGARWPLKCISEEKTAIVANTIVNAYPNTTILILGGIDEIERNRKIKKLCHNENIINITPTANIRNFAAIVNVCNLVICADTLALHIAHALNKHAIAFFCPTSPWEISMFGLGPKLYKRNAYLCTYKKDLPIDDDPTVDAEEIITRAKNIIKDLRVIYANNGKTI